LTVFRQFAQQPGAGPKKRPRKQLFLNPFEPGAAKAGWHGSCMTLAKPLSAENNMTIQFGQKQLVLELSKAPFSWFHGKTERMRLTSLSLLFVQFSLFARQPAV
jgi:hypothetical protein